ncbi:cupin domain-containing protein [Rhodococcus globerulus]|uniref:cupin domain-containing protein n=1 Tax=Rhodococcus globerulus TaxID=33008 RepID=UPI003018AA9C
MGTLRRVVTATDAAGKSLIESDGAPPNIVTPPSGGGLSWADLWVVPAVPTDVDSSGDQAPGLMNIDPAPGGISWKRVTIAPRSRQAEIDMSGFVDEVRELAPGMQTGGEHDPEIPGRHRTASVDLLTVLEGEVWLELDSGEVCIRAGDFLVQRGTWHGWNNRSDDDCVVAVVMISTKSPDA